MNFHFFNEMQQVYAEQVDWMSDLIKIRNELTADYSKYVETETLEFNLSPSGISVGKFSGPTKMGLVEFHLESENSEKFMNLVRIRTRPNDEKKCRGALNNESGSTLIYFVDENGEEDQGQVDVNSLLSRLLEILPKALFDQTFYRSWGSDGLPESALLTAKFQRLNFELLMDDFASIHAEENLQELLLRTSFPILTPTFLQGEIRAQAALIGLLGKLLSSLTQLDTESSSDRVKFESFELNSAPDFNLLETKVGPQFEGLSIIFVDVPTGFVPPILNDRNDEMKYSCLWLYLGICDSLERGEILRTLFGESSFAVSCTGPFQFDYFPSTYFSENPGPLKVGVLKIPAKILTTDEAAGRYIEDNFRVCLSQHFQMLEDSIYTSNVI